MGYSKDKIFEFGIDYNVVAPRHNPFVTCCICGDSDYYSKYLMGFSTAKFRVRRNGKIGYKSSTCYFHYNCYKNLLKEGLQG